MIYPHTEVRFISPEMGYGVFATRDIPLGTILYVQDSLDIVITPEGLRHYDPAHRGLIEKYSFIDEKGSYVLSWDNAKYINHSCECNSISTGYGFEIATRSIRQGEEITDEYGLFNIPGPFKVNCGCVNCRGEVLPTDIRKYAGEWDSRIIPALRNTLNVEQPLWELLGQGMREELVAYVYGNAPYRSVSLLEYSAEVMDDVPGGIPAGVAVSPPGNALLD